MVYHKKLIIALLVLIASSVAVGQQYRDAVFLHQSTGSAYYYGTGQICVLSGGGTSATNWQMDVVNFNTNHGFTGGDAFIITQRGVPTGGSPLGASNSIEYWYHTFKNDAGYEAQYNYVHGFRSTYSIIIIKECFTWHDYTTEAQVNTVKQQVRVVADSMEAYPNTFWVWWTTAPHNAQRPWEKVLADWMKDTTWAANIYILDYFNLLADEYGAQETQYRCSPTDQHPNGLAVNTFSYLMIDLMFDAALAYEGYTPSGADHISFNMQPNNTQMGSTILPPVTVRIEDASNNLVSGDMRNIIIAIHDNPNSGALSGILTRSAVNGVATFNDLSIDSAGNGYTLMASSNPALIGDTSIPFNVFPEVPPEPHHLRIYVEPTNTEINNIISPITVWVEDIDSNIVFDDSRMIYVIIGNNPSGGTLIGTTSVQAAGGRATFGDLRINAAGDGYTLVFGCTPPLNNVFTASFNITPSVNIPGRKFIVKQRPL